MVYIVILPDELGGAEKRFVGLWLHLQRTGLRDVGLVVPEGLVAKLPAIQEFAGFERYLEAIHAFPTADTRALQRLLFRLWRANQKSVFHYVFLSPLLVQRFPSRRTCISITTSTWRLMNGLGFVLNTASMLTSGHVDILNEPVWRPAHRALFWRRSSITVTPSSFVDLEAHRSLPFAEKKDRLSFVGLFSHEKQIYRLLEHLPELDRRLKERGFRPEFRLMGRDQDTPSATELARKLAPAIDVEAFHARNPSDVLAASKAFFSLQRASNYPSKSLLEAMACGNLPIVTDTPDSERIAPRAFSYYVPRDFTAEHLAAAALPILEMRSAEFDAKVAAAHAHLRANFSVERMASYFLDVYRRLGYTNAR